MKNMTSNESKHFSKNSLMKVGLTLAVIWLLCFVVFTFSMIGELWFDPYWPRLVGYTAITIYIAPLYAGFVAFRSTKDSLPITCLGYTLSVAVVCYFGVASMMLLAVSLRIGYGLPI